LRPEVTCSLAFAVSLDISSLVTIHLRKRLYTPIAVVYVASLGISGFPDSQDLL
jgi:hypothetical protein